MPTDPEISMGVRWLVRPRICFQRKRRDLLLIAPRERAFLRERMLEMRSAITVAVIIASFWATLQHAPAATIAISKRSSCDGYLPYQVNRVCGYWYEGYSIACYWYPNRSDCDWRYGWHWYPGF